MQYFRDTSDRHDLKDIIKSKCTQSCTQLGLGMKQINAPGSQHLDQPKRGRVRPRKDPNAGVQASKSDLPPTTLEVAGKDEEHICPLCQEAILEATSDREGHEAVFCDGVSCRVWYHR